MAQRERLSVPWRLEPSTDDRSDLVWIVYGERVTLPNGSIAGPSYILRTDPMIAEMIVNDHNAATRLADVESENARLAAALVSQQADINRLAAHLSDSETRSNYRYVLLTSALDYLQYAQRNGGETVMPLIADISKALTTAPAATAGGSAEDVG